MVFKLPRASPRMARHFLFLCILLNLVCHCMAAADFSQRSTGGDDVLLVRKERQVGSYNFNSLGQRLGALLSWIYVIPSTNSVISNSSTLVISDQFWSTLFSMLQYFTFYCWFAMLMTSYASGVAILYFFQYASQGGYAGQNVGNGGAYSTYNTYFRAFEPFEDENLSLFDKVTSVGYGFLDRASELTSILQTPECARFAMCHMSATLGDQEANGFIFKDLIRSISAQLDNKGSDGMTRAVNVGLLTGDCQEPIMSCPDLAPYFKKASETWSNYL